MTSTILQSKYIQSIIISCLTFALYVATMMPDIGFTDSGELAAVATTLGIAHPTGYPLYTILGHVWTLIMPYTAVYSLNLFAALCTALSIGIFFILMHDIMKAIGKSQKHASYFSATTSLLFATSTTVWQQATGLEVYSLQLVLFMLIIRTYMQAMWLKDSKNYILIWAFLLGLSFTNHGTTILLAPAMIVGYFYDWKSKRFVFNKDIVTSLLPLSIPFLLGLAVWLYLPIRSAQQPEFNWGEVHRSWDKFTYHALGKQYQVWMFAKGTVSQNMPRFIEAVRSLTMWICIIPALLGIYSAWKGHRGFAIFFLLMIAGNLFYSLNYGIHDIDTYFLTALIALAVFIGLGLQFILSSQQRFIPALLLLPLFNLGFNYSENDKHEDRTVPAYMHLMIDPMPTNSVIISSQWDYYCSAFLYKQSIEQYRPDIILVEQELLRRTWYPHHIVQRYPALSMIQKQLDSYNNELEKFESNIPFSPELLQNHYEMVLNSLIDSSLANNRPVFITIEVLQNEPRIAQKYAKIPQGLAFRIIVPPPSGLPELPLPLLTTDVSMFAHSIRNRKGHLYEGISTMLANELMSMAQYAMMTGREKEGQIFMQKSRMVTI